ncbi:hypothetical protein [Vitreoscilla sp. C1]|uniref:hypothetical protein n=1 Tax=Vitreoscilla sp. (strain C1) TaxID=96942 RepID=UPI000CDC8042|nr:hypothetical protein [Vitreoscilla sp. C1]
MSYPLKFKFYVDEELAQEVQWRNGFPTLPIAYKDAETVIYKFYVGCRDMSRELAVDSSNPDTNIKLMLAEAAQAWQANVAVTAGSMVQPGNGFMYRCISSGISGSTQPVWPTVHGQGVADGTVRYVCAGVAWDISNMFLSQSEEFATTSTAKVANLGPVLDGGAEFAVPLWLRAVNPNTSSQNDNNAPIMHLAWNKVIERENI